MYLPTFWKLTVENQMHYARHAAPWAGPVLFFGIWIGYYSLYNWIYTEVIPPPRGVNYRRMIKIKN